MLAHSRVHHTATRHGQPLVVLLSYFLVLARPNTNALLVKTCVEGRRCPTTRRRRSTNPHLRLSRLQEMVKSGGYTVSGAATKKHFSDGFRGLRSPAGVTIPACIR